MKSLHDIKLTDLRTLAEKVLAIFQTGNEETWEQEVKNEFKGYNTSHDGVDLLDNSVHYNHGEDLYSGFLEEINSQAMTSVEKMEMEIVEFANLLEDLEGEEDDEPEYEPLRFND